MEGGKAVLGIGVGEGQGDLGKQESFQDLHCRGKEGDRAVRRTEVRWFPGFEDGDDMGAFPDGGEVSITNREVKKVG